MDLKSIIRTVPDYPIPGIQFRDITSITDNAEAFNHTVTRLAVATARFDADTVVGIESRGFVFGAPVATKFDLPFILARKPSKLPQETYSKEDDTNDEPVEDSKEEPVEEETEEKAEEPEEQEEKPKKKKKGLFGLFGGDDDEAEEEEAEEESEPEQDAEPEE